MDAHYLERDNKPKLAYRFLPAGENTTNLPTVMFCGGFRSDMEGTKAIALEQACRDRGQGYLRFDYSGHGLSEGRFEDGTIGSWTEDALAIFDEIIKGPVLLVGSSMGGWISLLMAQKRPERVKGLVGIAAAPDFTREFSNMDLNETQKTQMKQDGYFLLPNDYGDPYMITRALLEDGEKHCLLDNDIPLSSVPIRLVQGMKDPAVPWQMAHRIKNAVPSGDVEVFLVESGDHSLSRPEDIDLIAQQISALS